MKFKCFVASAMLALGLFGRADAGYILDLDHAAFRAADTLGYVEIYASIQRNSLIYQPTADSLTADFSIVLEVLQDSGTVLADTFQARDVRDSTDRMSPAGQFFVHVFRFMMLPGHYGVRAALYQYDPDPRDVVTDSLLVAPFPAGVPRISDIELGTEIEFTEDTGPLVKNGVRLVPNPTGFFGTELPLFYYYAEVYGLDFDSAGTDSHTVVRRVIDAETGQPVRPDIAKISPTVGEAVVVADGFPVSTLRTGTYYLELEVQSQRSGRHVAARKKFWTYRREDLQAGRLLSQEPELQTRMASVAPDFLEVVDVDSALQWMKYAMTKDEQHQAGRLNAEGKRKFVNDFWAKRDAEKPGAANQYFARVVEVNRRYSFLKRPGWKTDRGRVFILYGEPSQTHYSYATPGMPDHEVWEYEQLEGGVQFVFFDRTGFGDLDLVHSTKRGEVYNPNWQELAPATHGRSPGGLR